MSDVKDGCVDLLLNPPASVSIYLTALVAADRRREVDAVWRSHGRAAGVALEALAHAGVWSAVGDPESSVPYRYDAATAETEAIEHGPREPDRGADLHLHLVIQLPSRTRLDRRSIERVLPFVRRRYERSLLDSLATELGVGIREHDGGAELVGVPDDLVAAWEPTPCRVRAGVPQLR